MQRIRDNKEPNFFDLFSNSDSEKQELISQLERLLEMAHSGQIDNILTVCYNSDNEVLTGYINLTPRERMTLTGYLQTELIIDIKDAKEGGQNHAI